MSNLITTARMWCMAGHEAVGQRRKYTDRPYWEHPGRVADLVSSRGYSSKVIAAAYMHDLIEDTQITAESLSYVFSDDIVNLVLEVTDVSKPEDGNRAFRKELDKKHLAKASAEGQTIKLADLIDNTSSILKYDRAFGIRYMQEKKELLEVLTKGDRVLHAQASEIVRKWDNHEYEQ